MSHKFGEPVRGILHSEDASSGVAVPVFNQGNNTARTLRSDEYLEIHSAELITAAGGDAYLLIGADATLGTGETVTRGTVAANGGVVDPHLPHVGRPGHTLFVVCPAGVVDVKVSASVHQVGTGARPDWKESYP